MSNDNLKNRLIRLGNNNPELREHIRPILASKYGPGPRPSKIDSVAEAAQKTAEAMRELYKKKYDHIWTSIEGDFNTRTLVMADRKRNWKVQVKINAPRGQNPGRARWSIRPSGSRSGRSERGKFEFDKETSMRERAEMLYRSMPDYWLNQDNSQSIRHLNKAIEQLDSAKTALPQNPEQHRKIHDLQSEVKALRKELGG